MVTDPKPPNDSPPLIGRPPGYHSYLLRFWEERGEESPSTIWRFSLEDPSTDQRLGFASLDALVDWLKTKISHSSLASD
jgi:hypothetical protein